MIIGTGMGGATLGYVLAKAGLKVLFCEKGKANPELRGNYPESTPVCTQTPLLAHRESLANAGRWWEEIEDRCSGKTFVPFIGSGAGGSSALYGMALERLFPADFTPDLSYPDAGTTSVPQSWPISYEELVPYYSVAEELYRVRGERDPLRIGDTHQFLPSPPLQEGQQLLFDFLLSRGLHPYRLPLACDHVPDCRCCQAYLCDKGCKNSSARICLEPAIAEHGATLLDECEALHLLASPTRVNGVVCSRHGERFVLRSKLCFLAAGALSTPLILLRSASDCWPEGLANASGLVGRYLMRHFVDLYLLAFPEGPGRGDKAIAFNDFYHSSGTKLGTVQSFGLLPPPAMLTATIESDLRRGRTPWLAGLFRPAEPFARLLLDHLLAGKTILTSIVEDLPWRENRIELSASGGVLHYRIPPYDRERIAAMRLLVRQALKPRPLRLLRQAENNERIAHACGTCRFGNDPRESVLDADNRAHGIENLYVVDASFFPTSGGTNPALTIAANAVRVAERILGRPILRSGGEHVHM